MDAKQKAEKIVRDLAGPLVDKSLPLGPGKEAWVSAIAAAIQAENEACAKVADSIGELYT